MPNIESQKFKIDSQRPKTDSQGQNSVNCPYTLILKVDVKEMSKFRSF